VLIAGGIALAIIGLVAWILALQAALPRVDELATHVPARTAIMREREAEARARGKPFRPDQRWIPLDRISPLLRDAVLVAEDDAFFQHGGLDWRAIRESAQRNVEAGRIVRGGSTITQQLAKNLYLGSERTIPRKAEEILLALRLERALSKRRILELYLNLIEWGDGIFGVEAAARRYYGVSASALDARESAHLAAVIVNPRRFSPLGDSPRIERRAHMILARLYRRGVLTEAEYRAALGPEHRGGFWDWILGGRRSAEAPGSPAIVPGDSAQDSLEPPADTLPGNP
jgi:monofunctional biosynthetic peptidoglycan transglycosylase